MFSPETIYTQPTEMDSKGFIYIFVHTYSHMLNKEETEREKSGKGWRKDKEGGD